MWIILVSFCLPLNSHFNGENVASSIHNRFDYLFHSNILKTCKDYKSCFTMGNTWSNKIQYLFTVYFPLTLTLSTCFHNYLGHHIPTWSVLHLPVPTLTFAMRLFHTCASALRFLCNILHSLLGSEQFIHNHLSLAHSLFCKVLWVLTNVYHRFTIALSFRMVSYPQISCIPCSPLPLLNPWQPLIFFKTLFIVLPFPKISIIGII